MNNFYKIRADVAGNWGENTIAQIAIHPPVIEYLDYEFADWLGDDLLTSFPIYIVSEKLANLLKISNLSGFELAFCEVSKAEIFHDLHPEGLELPPFFWLKIHGKAQEDDFGISQDFYLIVSEKALEILQTCNLHYADIEEVSV